jgi:hypothetical protein
VNRNSLAVLAPLAFLLLALPARAQDLLTRSRGSGGASGSVQGYAGQDRLDLLVGSSYPTPASDRKYAQLGLAASLSSDFACGKFDLHASLKNLVTKEAGKEMGEALLGAVESELMYNALVLACETSPTACQAFQHFRVNANALLGVGYSRCQAIQQGVQDGIQGAQARSIKDCVDQKRQQGVTDPNDAMTACQNANKMSGLTGASVTQFDLGKELEKALNLPAGETQDLSRLLSGLRITPQGATGSIQAEGVLQEYARIQNDYAQAWTEATQRVAQNSSGGIDPDLAKRLQPESTPGPLPVNLPDIADLPPDQQAIFIRWIAGLMALTTLEAKVQKIERYLMAGSKVPTLDKGTVTAMEKELQSLRMQMRHVDEQVRRQDEQNKALLGIIQAAEALKRDRAATSIARAQGAETTKILTDIYAPKYGAPRVAPTPPPPGPQGARQGPGCTNCPTGGTP